MYGWLWRHLPGRWPLRLAELALLLVGALALLFYVVFPTTDPHLPFNRVTIDQPATTVTTTPSPTPTSGTG